MVDEPSGRILWARAAVLHLLEIRMPQADTSRRVRSPLAAAIAFQGESLDSRAENRGQFARARTPDHNRQVGRTNRIRKVAAQVCARLATWAPFTYSRTVAPSNVAAKCVHVFTAKIDGAKVFWFPDVNVPPNPGRLPDPSTPSGNSRPRSCRPPRATPSECSW